MHLPTKLRTLIVTCKNLVYILTKCIISMSCLLDGAVRNTIHEHHMMRTFVNVHIVWPPVHQDRSIVTKVSLLIYVFFFSLFMSGK